MTVASTETYRFAYELSYDSSTNTLRVVSDNPSAGSNGTLVDPAAGQITVSDPSASTDGGTVSLDQTIDITKAGPPPLGDPTTLALGGYTFLGTAEVKDHGTTLDGIVVENQSTGTYFLLTNNEYTGELAGKNGTLSVTGYETTICFTAGTQIRTPNGEVAVEQLKRGDLVLTQDGRSVPVDWMGVQTISLRFADKLRVLPIRIRAGALAENVPSRDLLVSPDHAILVEGALIHAGALVNGTSIVRETNVPTTFTYYHVEVEDHSLILAENTPAETFVDNVDRLHFDNWAEHEALYPNGKHVEELPYPRAKSHRQVPVSIRVMLGARAQVLGTPQEKAVA
jgi:hypothetical protein